LLNQAGHDGKSHDNQTCKPDIRIGLIFGEASTKELAKLLSDPALEVRRAGILALGNMPTGAMNLHSEPNRSRNQQDCCDPLHPLSAVDAIG
jgi:hypothetical protein